MTYLRVYILNLGQLEEEGYHKIGPFECWGAMSQVTEDQYEFCYLLLMCMLSNVVIRLEKVQ